jgi:UDP-N-acetylmuramyl tripeptide synthase
MGMRIRFWLALWSGKLISIALRILGKKGTTFPGLVANKVCPDFIKHLAASFQGEIVLITGTNGKTTTNNMLASILKTANKTVAFNREGANMLPGIAGTLLQNSSFWGRIKKSYLLLEVDEATVPRLCRQLTPGLAVITNFFPDQLDRFGELDTTIRLVQEALPSSTKLILNADDPLVAQIGLNQTQVFYYGAASLPVSGPKDLESREGRYCFLCDQELFYEIFHYGQLGIYHCEQCGFERPQPHIEAWDVQQKQNGISFRLAISPEHREGNSYGGQTIAQETGEFIIPLQGYYNLYNALAAVSAAECLGLSWEDSRQGLLKFVSDAGRMEQFALPSCQLTLTLVKNPMGFNQVVSTLIELDRPLHLLLAINDLAADGRDISWLWDVDFERFVSGEPKIKTVICSGLRAEDMALRLKYAGWSEDVISINKNLKEAVAELEAKQILPDEAVFVLSSYTALFPLREILNSKKVSSNPVISHTEVEGL